MYNPNPAQCHVGSSFHDFFYGWAGSSKRKKVDKERKLFFIIIYKSSISLRDIQ